MYVVCYCNDARYNKCEITQMQITILLLIFVEKQRRSITVKSWQFDDIVSQSRTNLTCFPLKFEEIYFQKYIRVHNYIDSHFGFTPRYYVFFVLVCTLSIIEQTNGRNYNVLVYAKYCRIRAAFIVVGLQLKRFLVQRIRAIVRGRCGSG